MKMLTQNVKMKVVCSDARPGFASNSVARNQQRSASGPEVPCVHFLLNWWFDMGIEWRKCV